MAKKEKLVKKLEAFDKTSENFKKIFTDKGMNLEEFAEFVFNALKLIPDEDRLPFLVWLIEREILLGTDTMFEAVGVIELAKDGYLRMMKCPNDDDFIDDDDSE
jgi:hypothetical protein